MARMIPSSYDETRTPPGEKLLFSRLSNAPDNWTIIHSLDIAPRNRSRRTEIDFVVIIPELGILCLEVKSQENIEFDGSMWLPKSLTRSPFTQALDARKTLQRGIKHLIPRFGHLPFAGCCVFTHSDFNLSKNLSASSWELIDRKTLASISDADLANLLSLCIESEISADPQLNPLERPLMPSDLDALISILQPYQIFCPERRTEFRMRDQELNNALLEQQRNIVELVDQNPRALVDGPAGTGKTLIAYNLAVKYASHGNRVALVCFNTLIGKDLQRRAEKEKLPRLVCGTATSLLAELAKINLPKLPDQKYWDELFWDELESKLTDPDLDAPNQFDYLVVDEAQDILLRPRMWDCLISLLRGGTDSGRFTLFGDFKNQVLGSRQTLESSLNNITKTGHPSKWRLTQNCRNYSIIGNAAIQLAGFPNDIYEGYLRKGGHSKLYDIDFYQSSEGQAALLAQKINWLISQGYRNSEITVLSVRRNESAIAATLALSDRRLYPVREKREGIAYCTIHSFKGLENKAIILSDCQFTDDGFDRSLFYIGITRATECVIVLCSEDSQELLTDWISRRN